MKNWIARASAAAFAAGLAGTMACGSSSGCGGSNNNTNSQTAITCGPGTAQQGGMCVPTSTPQTR